MKKLVLIYFKCFNYNADDFAYWPPKVENAKGQSEVILLSIPFSINIDALLFTG
jgi:hypothetical protein